jgi:hypothetical protein
MGECVHCDAGHAPVLQASSREWIHRRSWALDPSKPGAGRQFSIVLCVRLSPPAGKMPRLRRERVRT